MAKVRPGSPIQLGIAILLGYFSIAVAFGVTGRDLGFPLLVLIGLSVFVFAGASQFLAIQLLAQGVGGVAVIVATLILNARHVVMSLAVRDRIEGDSVPKPVLAFGITDEVFASAAIRVGPIRDVDLLTMEILAYSGWVGGTIAGFVVGRFLPPAIEEAMGIALYAMFVSLIVPGIARFRRYGMVVAAAGAFNYGITSLGLSRGPALLVAIVLPAIVFALGPRWSEPT
ncbi:MAG: AzlC family ABC transporter permease [Spirochaetia bacterium]